MSIAGRKFISCHGQNNVPDGEIYTGPVENSVNGWERFSFPCIWSGNQVDAVEFVFEEGKVVKASAEKNVEFLQAILNTNPGAQYLDEFGIGTNRQIKQFTGNMLFDEKIGGTIHLAIGNGYPASGSMNKSAVHWECSATCVTAGRYSLIRNCFTIPGKSKFDGRNSNLIHADMTSDRIIDKQLVNQKFHLFQPD